MRVPEHRAAGPGELVAIDLPPGEAWLEMVGDLWWRGVAFLPLDRRLSGAERRRVIDRAQPTCITDRLGETAYPGRTVAPGIGLVVATSGTGGEPRLAELSRSAVERAVALSAEALGSPDATPWILCLTPSHVGGIMVLLRGAILGVPVIVHERFEPHRVADSAEGGAFVSLVPTMVRRMLDADVPFDGLTMLVGGGPLDPDTAAAAGLRGARVVTTYGMTESCGGVVYDGRPLEGTRLRITDQGGIELQGPTLMEGYRGDPGATGAAFTTDGWFRSGDLGAFDDDGVLRILGRADDVIRTGAEKVWPEEVEVVLTLHPKVRDARVAGAPHPEWGEQVVAYVVPAVLDDPPTLEELRAWATERLAPFKVPRALELVPDVPRTGSGKVRRDLRPG